MSWPNVDWLPGAKRVPLYYSGLGDYTDESHPKLLLHTTEGYSVDTSEAAYRSKGFAPHLTIGPDPAGGHRLIIDQHYPFTSRATTLEDPAGGVRTNRECVLQIEIVGFCDPKYASSDLYIHNWPDWYWKAIADVCADVCRLAKIPVKQSVTWAAYPGSYGTGAKQRLTDAQFHEYVGILGHEHAPENVHGDPGDLDIAKLLSLMGPAPTPQPKPQPAPVVKEPLVATRKMSVADKTPLPRSRYKTLHFGRNDKGALVSVLTPSDDYAGSYTATVSLWLDGPKGFDHLEILPYAVDSKSLKVAEVWPVAPIDVWHTGGTYRLHAVFAYELAPNQRLRFQAQSDFKGVTIRQARVDVSYEKKAA